MKRYPLLLLVLALSCVGQKDDEPEDFPQVPAPVEAEAAARSLILDFTATWCVNCPRMTSAIEEAGAERPGEIVPLCVHFSDVFKCDDANALVTRFGVQAYPSAVVDMDKESLITATSKEILLSRIDERRDRKKAACQLEVTASSSETGVLSVDARVTARAEGGYALWVLLVEDGLVAPQTGGSQDEVHNHVLRRFLHSGEDGYELGALKIDETATWKATFEGLSTDNCRVLAFVTEQESGLVNVVLSAPID